MTRDDEKILQIRLLTTFLTTLLALGFVLAQQHQIDELEKRICGLEIKWETGEPGDCQGVKP